MIELKNVTVLKRGSRLFQNFNWKINPNEHWLITGPNGTGKTILLELLAGKTHIVEGTIINEFVQGDSWEEHARAIHFIPANALHTIFYNNDHFYQQRYYSIGDEQTPTVSDVIGELANRINELNFPENLNIQSLLQLPVTRLSNGQQKKMIILKALALGIPRLLLLDYPFDGLDSDSRKDLCIFLDHLASAFQVQLILADHGHELPASITHHLELDQFNIVSQGKLEQRPLQRPEKIPSERNTHKTYDAPVVEMQDLTIRYNHNTIIHNLNWTVRKGERWALTGKNGSGKTTVFSLIYADHPMAYSEKVFLFGKRRGSGESIWDIKKRISYLGPELASYLNPGSQANSAREYIQQEIKCDSGGLASTIKYFGAETFIDKPVNTLSSGQLQLVLIISKFVVERELILLDEPFQFLDPDIREKVTSYIQSGLKEDTTLILITHDPGDIGYWTDHRMRL